MDSIIETFHIDWKIIIAQVLNFGIVFVVLYVYALRPLGKLMKERTEKIQKGVNDAKTNAELLENAKAEYEKALEKARLEAEKLFQQGKKEAEAKKAEMISKAKEEVALMISEGKKNLEEEKTRMVKEVSKEVMSLSVQMAEKIIEKKIGPDFDERVLRDLNNIK